MSSVTSTDRIITSLKDINSTLYQQVRYIFAQPHLTELVSYQKLKELNAQNLMSPVELKAWQLMDALDYVTQTLDTPIDFNYLRKLHQISQNKSNLFLASPKDVGHFRSENKYEFETDLFSPRSNTIDESLTNAIMNYNKSPKKISDICLLYLWIMSIHPFVDGNGRVAELIIWKELIAHNYMPVILNKHVYAELALIGNQFSKNQIGVLQGFVLFCDREQKRFQMYAQMAPGSRYPWFVKLI